MYVEDTSYSDIEWDHCVENLPNNEFQIDNEAQASNFSPNNREGLESSALCYDISQKEAELGKHRPFHRRRRKAHGLLPFFPC
jgi:hypothetical protein